MGLLGGLQTKDILLVIICIIIEPIYVFYKPLFDSSPFLLLHNYITFLYYGMLALATNLHPVDLGAHTDVTH